jgi:diamine N-acetyltransferase
MSEGLTTPREKVNEEVRYFATDTKHAADLRAMARRCFADTFSHLYDSEPFDEFLDHVYGERGSMSKGLLDPL